MQENFTSGITQCKHTPLNIIKHIVPALNSD